MMKSEGEQSSNGSTRSFQNGSGLSNLHKMALSNSTNGTRSSSTVMNGHSFSNGHSKPRPTYFGHDREEVTRLLLQTLSDLGFNGAAGTLSQESGYDLESPSVAAFRNAVIQGEWGEAEDLLFGTIDDTRDAGVSSDAGGLLLADGADRHIMKFWIRQQKYLELLEQRDTGRALHVLRTELQPLHHDIGRVHFLSSLVMCPSPDDLRRRADWDGARGSSREILLSELSRCISPSVMIPEHRLAVLLQQVKHAQISQCIYHYTEASPSLYMDHHCDRNQFPLHVERELTAQTGEVWQTQFSHDGAFLASGGSDGNVFIYDVETWEVVANLGDHENSITYLKWSPDDSMIVTCSIDNRAKLWRPNGELVMTLPSWDQPVTSCVWVNDGQSFITGSLSKNRSLAHWNLNGDLLYDWSAADRISGIAMSANGQYLVAIDVLSHVHVYNFVTKELEYEMDLRIKPQSISISQNSAEMLIGMENGETRLIEIESRETIKTFAGVKAGEFVIQTDFGGANESFVISGSEDGHVFIWHKENGQLIEKLDAHSPGCCNAVSWNPANPCMFASGGDDHKIRIWSNGVGMESNNGADRSRPENGNRTSSYNDWRITE